VIRIAVAKATEGASMHARVSTIQLDPARIDETVSEFEEQDLPNFKQIDGFRGFTLLIDRTSGKVIGTSYWDSRERMEASEEEGERARERVAERGGSQSPPAVERFEVALDTFVG
jgi:heme-degrading monooxygenase HmoA